MKDKRNYANALVPIALAGGLIGGFFIGSYHRPAVRMGASEKVQTVLSYIDQQYVDKVDVDSLMESMLPDLLGSLDPHSAYIPKSELTAVNDELDGSFSGVGVMFQIYNDSVRVQEIVAGGPAERAGLKTGDIIVQANDSVLSRKGVTSKSIFTNLRGKEGTVVTLKVKRRGIPNLLEFDVVRGEVPQHTVDAKYIVVDGVGYIRVTRFARTTYQEFMNAIADLTEQGAEKFIIDLRSNGGGYMDQAIAMANEFLPADKLIVYTKGRAPGNDLSSRSDGGGRLQDTEIVVLTNEESASASEIFAGAIQDNDRGLVIGRRTFGKGLVQNQIDLPDSSAIRLTVSRYYTPSGRSIQKEYQRGLDGKYQADLLNRINRGELFHADSIKLDKSKKFSTEGGRTVYGGGGIMPDIFVPEDTVGYNSYYADVTNKGIVQKFSIQFADKYRNIIGEDKTLDNLERVLPRDQTLLRTFVAYAASQGVPARWYYINQAQSNLLTRLKAEIARELVGFESMIQLYNASDNTVKKGVEMLLKGKSPVNLVPDTAPGGAKKK